MNGRIWLFALLLSFTLLLPTARADFSLKSLTVNVNVNVDGSANVEEQIYIVMNSTESRDLYEVTRSAYSDISTWQERTNLSELRHHMTRVKADLSDIRVTPQAIDRCNPVMGLCYATIVLSYKVNAGQNGSGLIHADLYKPRTTRYSLVPDALSFEQTKSGDIILPAGTVISFAIPQSASKIYFSSIPSNVVDESDASFRYDQSANVRYYIGKQRIFNWNSNTLSKFVFNYEIEEPLENEVMEFFQSSQLSVISFLTGPQGIAALLLVAAAAVSFYYINRMAGK